MGNQRVSTRLAATSLASKHCSHNQHGSCWGGKMPFRLFCCLRFCSVLALLATYIDLVNPFYSESSFRAPCRRCTTWLRNGGVRVLSFYFFFPCVSMCAKLLLAEVGPRRDSLCVRSRAVGDEVSAGFLALVEQSPEAFTVRRHARSNHAPSRVTPFLFCDFYGEIALFFFSTPRVFCEPARDL